MIVLNLRVCVFSKFVIGNVRGERLNFDYFFRKNLITNARALWPNHNRYQYDISLIVQAVRLWRQRRGQNCPTGKDSSSDARRPLAPANSRPNSWCLLFRFSPASASAQLTGVWSQVRTWLHSLLLLLLVLFLLSEISTTIDETTTISLRQIKTKKLSLLTVRKRFFACSWRGIGRLGHSLRAHRAQLETARGSSSSLLLVSVSVCVCQHSRDYWSRTTVSDDGFFFPLR